MKKFFGSIILILFLIFGSLILVLATTGIQTDKFNKIISNKIVENNKNILLNLNKIKFKFDIKDLSLFIETRNPELSYQNLKIPIEKIKAYLDFVTLIQSSPKIDRIDLSFKEINISQLKKLIIKTKPSNLNSFINNRVKTGKLSTELEFYFDKNLKIKNFIARGEVKEMIAVASKDLTFKNTSFNFFADNSDVLVKNIESEIDGLLINSGNLQINKSNNIKINSDFFTKININENNINNYLMLLKKYKFLNNQIKFKANLNHNISITLDKTYKVIDYDYKNKGKINNLNLKFNKPINNSLLENKVKNINLKESNLITHYNNKKNNFIKTTGSYSFNKDTFQSYEFKNNFSNSNSDIEINFNYTPKLNLEFINYKKKDNTVAKISSKFEFKKDLINFKEINYKENKNFILIEDLKIKKKYIISFKKILVKTFSSNELKNDFKLDFGKKINIQGTKYDAKNLNKILNQNSKNSSLKNIAKNINIEIDNIETPLSKNLKNFKLIGTIEKGKFTKVSSKGDFGNQKFLDITLKSDKKNKKKYLEIYSDLPQPFLSDYDFFKGLSGGTLIFTSTIEGNLTNSKLIIDNFKVINAPGVVKLLSLADFGGLADLTEGDGLSFDKLEIKTQNKDGFIKLEELFAIGPSISVLMDGYKEANGLTSLRGTLVPAKNLNKFLSKIPVIGKIIIPKEVGEGLFGVSFKMKGTAGKIKTTINPIKTLTPRFITKALERTKRSK